MLNSTYSCDAQLHYSCLMCHTILQKSFKYAKHLNSSSCNHNNIIIIASYIVQYSFPLHTSATVGHKMSASNLNKHYEESFTQNYAFGHTFLPYQGPVSLFPKQTLDISIQSHLQWQQKREMTWCWTWLRLLSWAKGRYWNVRKSQTYL